MQFERTVSSFRAVSPDCPKKKHGGPLVNIVAGRTRIFGIEGPPVRLGRIEYILEDRFPSNDKGSQCFSPLAAWFAAPMICTPRLQVVWNTVGARRWHATCPLLDQGKDLAIFPSTPKPHIAPWGFFLARLTETASPAPRLFHLNSQWLCSAPVIPSSSYTVFHNVAWRMLF
jgi:hypothetical protein